MHNESNSEIWFDEEFPRDGEIIYYIGASNDWVNYICIIYFLLYLFII